MEPTPLSTTQKIKERKIESEDKKFSIKIILSSNIIIEIYELEKIQGSYYFNEFTLDSLIKLSRGFKVCENINEAYDILEEILEAKKSSINLKENNTAILIIEVALPGGRMQKAELILNKKEINKNILLEELVNKVNSLEKDNKKLKEEINELKQWKKKIEKLFEDEIKVKELIEKTGIDSKIVDNANDLKFLINGLINNDKFLKEKNINFNLLYRATRDGDNFNDFHSRVDNINSTLTIIKTSLGLKFGVFLEIPFKQTGNFIVDDKSFVFSLDLKRIYKSKPGTYSLNDYSINSGTLLDLYNQPIRIYVNCLTNNKSYTNSKSANNGAYLGFERDYEINNNQQYFTVAELETFQIKFN